MENNQEGTIIIKKTINPENHNHQPEKTAEKNQKREQLLGKVTGKHRKQNQAKSTRQNKQ